MLKNLVTFAAAAAIVPLLSTVSPVTMQAQTPAEPKPFIYVSSSATVKVEPDRARISIAVQTRHETAASAATENARKQTAVLKALRGLGLTDKQLRTANYNVSPSYRYEQNRDPILTGYTVNNTIIVEITDIEIVGKAIDVALANGANSISSLEFYASNTDEARLTAIQEATAKARREAQTAAEAAGGRLGGLLESNIQADRPYIPGIQYARVAAMASADQESTPINPAEQSIIVTVNTRWEYIAAQ